MLTDAPPRKANRAKFLESDRLTTLDLLQNGNLTELARSIELAMSDEKPVSVRKTCSDWLTEMPQPRKNKTVPGREKTKAKAEFR